MKAFVKKKEEIAKDVLLVEFELDREINFLPGQYFFITLISPLFRDEKGSMRHFTIVNSPHEKGIITMATKMRDTAFKKSLIAMPIGAEVNIDKIYGDFVLSSKFSFPLVFIANGIGVTPFISMLRCLRHKKKKCNITMIYINHDQGSAAFLEELKGMTKINENFRLILSFNNDKDWKGESGDVNGDFIKKYFSSYKSKIFYVSGPPSVVKKTEKVLLSLGIKKEKIKKEKFFGY